MWQLKIFFAYILLLLCYIFFMEHYMINAGKDLESQFCMSQLFSVIFFSFHCHKMLSLLAIRGPCWGVFSSLFNSMLSVFDFCFGASWLEINGSAFFNYRGNWSCHTPTSTDWDFGSHELIYLPSVLVRGGHLFDE